MTEKAYRIITDPRIARLILKHNPQMPKKYCPYCGNVLTGNCDCAKDIVLCDIKPNKYNSDATVFCFENSEVFKNAYEAVEATLAVVEKEI